MKFINICRLLILTCLLSVSCYNAGPYGYARYYIPLDDEEQYQVVVPIYNEVKRQPNLFANKLIAWFGVVESIEEGQEYDKIRLSYRLHIERHLCEDETEASCKVTISNKTIGSYTAIIKLNTEDKDGRNKVKIGSLIRTIGKISKNSTPESEPVIDVIYYRHWPRGQYFFAGMRKYFRR